MTLDVMNALRGIAAPDQPRPAIREDVCGSQQNT